MKATWLYRVAAIIFVLFALGHTFGFLTFKPPTDAGVAVMESMDKVHFTVGGTSFSYGGFYRGFGLSATVSMLFSAYLAWCLGEMARKWPDAIGGLGWVFAGVQVVGLVLSWIYFSLGPALFSGVVVVCLGWAAAVTGGTKGPEGAG